MTPENSQYVYTGHGLINEINIEHLFNELQSTEHLQNKVLTEANPILYTVDPNYKNSIQLYKIQQDKDNKILHITGVITPEFFEILKYRENHLSLIKSALDYENSIVNHTVEKFKIDSTVNLDIHQIDITSTESTKPLVALMVKNANKENPEAISDYAILSIVIPSSVLLEKCKEYKLITSSYTYITWKRLNDRTY